MKIPLVFRVFFFVIVPVWILAWVSLRAINPQVSFADNKQEVAYWEQHGEYNKAAEAALQEVNSKKNSFSAHAVFLRLYMQLASRERTLIDTHVKKVLGDFPSYYKHCKKSSDTNIKDIGIYGTCIFDFYVEKSKNIHALLQRLDSVQNKRLAYVNELCFEICDKGYSSDSTIMYLEREVDLNPHNEYAWSELLMKLSYGEYNRLELEDHLKKADSLKIQLQPDQKRWIAGRISPLQYIKSLYEPLFYTHSITEIIIAVLIFFTWLVFLLSINVFKEVSWGTLIVVFVLALLLHPFVMVLYEWMYELLLWMEIYIFRSIWEEIFITGLLEETTKLMPLLLVLMVAPGAIKSPITILFIGALSALVFAFEENILYFGHYYNISISSGRAVLSVAMHLFTGSLTAYGFVLVKYGQKKWYWVPLLFVLAICIHGCYNYFLTLGQGWFSIVLTICCMFAWGSMVSNCLNNSPTFNSSKSHALHNKSILIIVGLSAILVIEFVLTAYEFGYEDAEQNYARSLLRNVWLIFVMGISFTRIELEKSKWDFIDFYGFHHLSLFGSPADKKIIGVFNSSNAVFNSGEALEATIGKKVKSMGGDNWYIINTTSQKMPKAIIKFKEEGENFYDFNVYVHVRPFTGDDPETRFDLKQYPFLGFMMISPELDKV